MTTQNVPSQKQFTGSQVQLQGPAGSHCSSCVGAKPHFRLSSGWEESRVGRGSRLSQGLCSGRASQGGSRRGRSGRGLLCPLHGHLTCRPRPDWRLSSELLQQAGHPPSGAGSAAKRLRGAADRAQLSPARASLSPGTRSLGVVTWGRTGLPSQASWQAVS